MIVSIHKLTPNVAVMLFRGQWFLHTTFWELYFSSNVWEHGAKYLVICLNKNSVEPQV